MSYFCLCFKLFLGKKVLNWTMDLENVSHGSR